MRERKNEFRVAFQWRVVLLVFGNPSGAPVEEGCLLVFVVNFQGGVAIDGSVASSTVRPAAHPFILTGQFAALWPSFLQTKQRLLSQ